MSYGGKPVPLRVYTGPVTSTLDHGRYDPEVILLTLGWIWPTLVSSVGFIL